MFKTTLANVQYLLPLGAIKKVNAANLVEREVVLRGDVDRTTYEFDRKISFNNAWNIVNNALPNNANLLFSCDGLACGSSNGWANDVLSIKQLYGLDQSQKVRAYAVGNDGMSYLLVYFIQRGNKRIYAQLDKITTQAKSTTPAPSASAISEMLTQAGAYDVRLVKTSKNNDVEFNEQELASIVSVLKAKPFSKFYLVGHSYSGKTLEANHTIAALLAQRLLDQLSDQGLDVKRFSVQSVASLSPDKALGTDRVSLVVRTDGT